MPVAVCPNTETLTAFARGDLAADELAGVAEHVGGCAACGAALQFVPDDSLAALARAAAASPDTVHSTAPPSVGVPGAAGHTPAGFTDHPRYRIVGEIGAGGMGTVYKAEDLLMGRTIAIKVVSPHLTAKATAVERFRKEIRAAAQLNHPAVITAHDTGEAGGAHFLVMEYIEGVSLDRLVAKKGPLAVPMACAFTRHAALGLQHAADKGMVHRDIKPQNLMVTRKGQVKILDFGLARFARAEADEGDALPMKLPFGAGKATAAGQGAVTNPNMLMGTPDYLSPEQAKNSHDVDHRSDIYSLGCTLYFLLTGKAPFLGASTLIDKLLAHTNDEPPAVRDKRPEVPPGLADVLAKMMAKKPGDRYQTAAEVAGALLPFTRTNSSEPVFEIVDAVVITPTPLVGPPVRQATQLDTDPVPGGPTLAETPRPKSTKKPKRKKASWWKRRQGTVIGGAVAALVLLVAFVVATRGKKPANAPPDAPTDPTASAKANPNPQTNPPQGKTDKTDKTDNGTKTVPPVVITPPTKAVKVLYVIPSNGVWWDDYREVRSHLESKGMKVETAATEGDRSRVQPRPFGKGGGPPPSDVPIDVRLKADMDLSEYAAVLFCGERIDEYVTGKGAFAASKVIQRMQVAGKPVGAIGVGQGVLVAHDVLRGKRAARCDPLCDKYPLLTGDKSGVTWDARGVTVAGGKIVTASGGRESVQFADAILKLIEGN